MTASLIVAIWKAFGSQ